MNMLKPSLVFALLTSTSYIFAQDCSSNGLDLNKVFMGSPLIYSTLILMSIASLSIWLYCLWTWREHDISPKDFKKQIRQLLNQKQFDDALNACSSNDSAIATIIASGLSVRKHGHETRLKMMHSEGQRLGLLFWQKISILNDIATTAPMLGLLGTVVGMFYAFYDTNRSVESITAIFDGLGIAIGTTVIGLLVAIAAMVFHAMLKLKASHILTTLEAEVQDFSLLMDP